MAGVNPLDLTARTILVTGASSGIGRDTAILLSALGARVILVGRNRDRLDAARGALSGDGHLVSVCDLAAYEAVPAWLKELSAQHGPLHGLVHSAGLHMGVPLRMIDAAQVEALWRVNVSAALWLAKGFRQRGVPSSDSSLVFLASVIGLAGQPALSAYSASKGAVIALTRSLAMELARERIRVNCVAPGTVRGEMLEEFASGLSDDQLAAIEQAHPLGLGTARDVSGAVAYLLSPAAKWMTGATLVVDGGYTAH